MNIQKKYHEWCIIEEGFKPENQRANESIFSLGNGYMGQRAMFEEHYSGDSLQGNYIAGIYYPDKTKVGWWKNGYPESFAKVLNAPNWIGIDVEIDGEMLDLAKCKTGNFIRMLHMKEGILERSFTATLSGGKKIKVNAVRFLSLVNPEIGAIHYSVTPLNFSGKIQFTPHLDAHVFNEDSNYNESFWHVLQSKSAKGEGSLVCATKKTDFHIGMHMKYDLFVNQQKQHTTPSLHELPKYNSNSVWVKAEKHQEISIFKCVSVLSSHHYPKNKIASQAQIQCHKAYAEGFETLLNKHTEAWAEKWRHSDVVIEGDVAAQQGIRFNIFQLNQTYTGSDTSRNIGPKGFTGEKYGGATYWDTEAYCLPFFLGTAEPKVAKNLLIYRYNQLDKAIENAEKLGFTGGAALYPMVTITGEECHNEWEITFEEIHRNGAIAFAIYNYIRYTGDQKYLEEYGLEVLIGIARFWSQRTSYSEAKQQYVILGVTGPNEYENNVNNNWYTNTIAVWCLQYATEALRFVKNKNPLRYEEIHKKTAFRQAEETRIWQEIIENMYFPVDRKRGVFLQQDGYLDKELECTSDLHPSIRPLNQHWSWDRILRSCFIKQADVLQGIYWFEDSFDLETIQKNYDFYEPKTVHESSLSPCIHAILAAKTEDVKKAYRLHLKASRLDLDDDNKELSEGLHVTSMAGAWMSVVEGFGGMRVKNGTLHFKPILPKQWKSCSFKIRFRNNLLKIKFTASYFEIVSEEGLPIHIFVNNRAYKIEEQSKLLVKK